MKEIALKPEIFWQIFKEAKNKWENYKVELTEEEIYQQYDPELEDYYEKMKEETGTGDYSDEEIMFYQQQQEHEFYSEIVVGFKNDIIAINTLRIIKSDTEIEQFILNKIERLKTEIENELLSKKYSSFHFIEKYSTLLLHKHLANINPELDNSELNQFIYDEKIDAFLKFELRLKADGYILPNNNWVNGRGKNQKKGLFDLVLFIKFLKLNFFLKQKFINKKLKDTDYKKYFEKRYNAKIEEQFRKFFKPEYDDMAKSNFTFLSSL